MKQAFVIPVYNHGSTLEGVVSSLSVYDLPIIVVDDGNGESDKKYINAVCEKFSGITKIVNKKNRGKGYSVCVAVKLAHKMQITHLFQIDADGQHDMEQVANFLKLSEENPKALISGVPVFDKSIPEKRRKGKKISNGYAGFVTLTRNYIKDAMCGYRIYPVEPFYNICRGSAIDSHMGFDTEILVKMVWYDVPLLYLPVKVYYPEGGKSNFRMVRDNLHISWMFVRLTFGMIVLLPFLLARKVKKGFEKSRTSK